MKYYLSNSFHREPQKLPVLITLRYNWFKVGILAYFSDQPYYQKLRLIWFEFVY